MSGGEFQLLAGNILSGDLENAMQERGMRIEVIGGNHTKAALMTLYRQGLRNPYVQMTLYEGLTDEEALKVGLHHNETNLKAKPMSFLDKVDVIVKLKQDIKAVASVFQKKNGRQVRNDLGVHMAVSRWPNEIIERLHQADQKWCSKKPLSQTLLRGLIKHSEMRKYMDKGTEILVQEGVQAFKEKMNQWMQVEGVGHFRNKKPTEAKGKTTVKETVKETNEKEHSVKQNYQVGDVVMAKWKDGRKYDAVIKRVEIIYHVQYLEDNVQRKVSETDIEEKDIQ
ncbi:uncharacterized protein LOC132746355 [Ruditapes philippinarum]|uniref:uncharacterized protein LOC132746355 n=1 Tax=Ruditapes philippinarum TaxID=129788 RepID=UPI00295BD4C4|nr:uncharacterized protein LOC132746355 [Ruditapes philippinarum]